jgi:hemolysin III
MTATAIPAFAVPANSSREQSVGEEIANSISHGVACLMAIGAAPVLLYLVADKGAANIVGASIFVGTMVLLYLISALYHALPEGRAKRVFMRLDHGFIYLFIAGTYTPFTLGALSGPWGWTLFGIIWGLAAIGVVMKACNWLSHPWLSTGLYLLMGWLVLIAAIPMLEKVAPAGIAWLVAGGLAYTLGVVFYVLDSRLRFAHFIWHLFVMGGTSCHFFAVLWYAA